MPALLPPVPGAIVRPFAYSRAAPFARGEHRGIDLGAPAGAPVVAPCAGAVAYAGPVGVTLACGRWRVTLLPARPSVRAGARVTAGAAVGTVRGTAGLHLGVRRARDPFGYVNPTPLLRRHRPPPPLVGPRRRPRAAPRPAPARRAVRAGPIPRLAPPLAWAGVAALLAGAAGSAPARRRARARRDRPLVDVVRAAGAREPHG